MTHLRLSWLLLAVLPLFATGCCCVQGVSSCSTGNCGGGSLASLSSCRGACGDVYVDEWISEPPRIDNCCQPTPQCGGCGQCNQCQPVRNVLKALWGRPYSAHCPNDIVGPSCGCDTCSSGHSSSSCDCGMDHSQGTTVYSSPSGGTMREVPHDATEMKLAPTETNEVVPTPAPEIDPMASRQLNPAARRRAVQTASARHR